MTTFQSESIKDFTEVLASKAPVPGGGGASALVGAIGIALGNMVGELTVGKKKYMDVEEDIKVLMARTERLRVRLLQLIDDDAECFAPLANAYSIPKGSSDRDIVMETALRVACSVPLDIMRTVCKALELINEFAQKGSALAISDAGVGAVFCKAALKGASLNVFINTKAMKDRCVASAFEKEADEMLSKYCLMADEIYEKVMKRIR